jgi:hypothetical protein
MQLGDNAEMQHMTLHEEKLLYGYKKYEKSIHVYVRVSWLFVYFYGKNTSIVTLCKKKKLVECQFCCLFRAHNFVLCIHIHVEFCMNI